MSVARPVIHSSSDVHCVAVWDKTVIQLWIGGTPAYGVREVRALVRQLAGSYQGVLVVIAADADLPNQEARAELQGLAREVGSWTGRTAVVFEGSGFRASAVRSIMVSLAFAAGVSLKYKIFATVSEGARWLAEEPGHRFDAAHLEAAVRDLRRGVRGDSLSRFVL